MLKIVRADGRHRADINRLLRDDKIGPALRGPVPRNTWVAKLGDRIVGYASMDFIGNRAAILEGIVVEEALRQRGIGSALVNHRIGVARNRGIDVFALATMYYWFNFYKRRGFKTCPRRLLHEFLRNYSQFTAERYMKCAVMVRGIPIERRPK